MCMPRDPDVLGQPTSLKSSSVDRTMAATSRTWATRFRAPDRDRREVRRDDRDLLRARGEDAARGRRGLPSRRGRPRRAARLLLPCGRTENSTPRLLSRAAATALRASDRKLAVNAIRVAHKHVRLPPAARSAPSATASSSEPDRASCSPPVGTALCADSRSAPRARRSRGTSCSVLVAIADQLRSLIADRATRPGPQS